MRYQRKQMLRRTQHNGCKESTAGGVIWKKGLSRNTTGPSPKTERDAKGGGERGHRAICEEKGKQSLTSIISLAKSFRPHQRPLHFIPKPGEHKQRDEKVEFLFTLADRNLNLSNPPRTKDLRPLMS